MVIGSYQFYYFVTFDLFSADMMQLITRLQNVFGT